jgi:hypothetical protein
MSQLASQMKVGGLSLPIVAEIKNFASLCDSNAFGTIAGAQILL